MEENFQRSVDFVLMWECEWDEDAGGTIFGVTKKWWPEDFEKMLPMNSEDRRIYAIEFYYREFWSKNGCRTLDWPLDIIVFDTAVNQGSSMALDLLNDACLICSCGNWKDYLLRRIQKYVSLKGQVQEGWLNRVLEGWPDKPGLYRLIREMKGGAK